MRAASASSAESATTGAAAVSAEVVRTETIAASVSNGPGLGRGGSLSHGAFWNEDEGVPDDQLYVQRQAAIFTSVGCLRVVFDESRWLREDLCVFWRATDRAPSFELSIVQIGLETTEF